jgi:hypothetical protein
VTITVAANGATANGTTSVALPYLDNASAGDLLLACISSGNPTDAAPTPPDGTWTQVAHFAGGGGTFGVDTGPRIATIFARTATGSETTGATVTFTQSGTNATFVGHIIRLTKTDAEWSLLGTGGADTTSGTAYSVTGAANIGLATGDLLLTLHSYTPDSATVGTTETLTVTGATMGTVSQQRSTNTTQGGDCRVVTRTTPVSSGTESAAPTTAMTASVAVTGASVFLRIREQAAAGITGTGAASAEAGTATGAGTSTVTGTGAGTAAQATATGAGTSTATGAGAAAAPAATAAGSGAVSLAGAGAATGPEGTAEGAGTASVTGTGAATAPEATASGAAGEAPVTGTGAATAAEGAAAGAGTSTATGAGTATAPEGVAAGAGVTVEEPVDVDLELNVALAAVTLAAEVASGGPTLNVEVATVTGLEVAV